MYTRLGRPVNPSDALLGPPSLSAQPTDSSPIAVLPTPPTFPGKAARLAAAWRLHRKSSYGNRSERGADCQAVLMSIFRTLKQRGHDPIRTVINALREYLTTGQLPPLPAPKDASDG